MASERLGVELGIVDLSLLQHQQLWSVARVLKLWGLGGRNSWNYQALPCSMIAKKVELRLVTKPVVCQVPFIPVSEDEGMIAVSNCYQPGKLKPWQSSACRLIWLPSQPTQIQPLSSYRGGSTKDNSRSIIPYGKEGDMLELLNSPKSVP